MSIVLTAYYHLNWWSCMCACECVSQMNEISIEFECSFSSNRCEQYILFQFLFNSSNNLFKNQWFFDWSIQFDTFCFEYKIGINEMIFCSLVYKLFFQWIFIPVKWWMWMWTKKKKCFFHRNAQHIKYSRTIDRLHVVTHVLIIIMKMVGKITLELQFHWNENISMNRLLLVNSASFIKNFTIKNL